MTMTSSTAQAQLPLSDESVKAVGSSLRTLHIRTAGYQVEMSRAEALRFSLLTSLTSLTLQGDQASFDTEVLDALLGLPSLQDVSLQMSKTTMSDYWVNAPCNWRRLSICPEACSLWARLPLHSLQHIGSPGASTGAEGVADTGLELRLGGSSRDEFQQSLQTVSSIIRNLARCPAANECERIRLAVGWAYAEAAEVLRALLWFQQLLMGFPQAGVELEVTCPRLDRSDMQVLAQRIPRLTHLTLNGCILPEAGSLHTLLELPELRQVTVQGVRGGPDFNAAHLVMWCAYAPREMVLTLRSDGDPDSLTHTERAFYEALRVLDLAPPSLARRGRGRMMVHHIRPGLEPTTSANGPVMCVMAFRLQRQAEGTHAGCV